MLQLVRTGLSQRAEVVLARCLLALYLQMLKVISQKIGNLQWKTNEIAMKFK